MTQPPETPTWLLWIVPVLALLGAAWAALRWFFSTVSREELERTVMTIENEQRERHVENTRRLDAIDARMGKVESGVARVEGQLSGRYPNLPGKR